MSYLIIVYFLFLRIKLPSRHLNQISVQVVPEQISVGKECTLWRDPDAGETKERK